MAETGQPLLKNGRPALRDGKPVLGDCPACCGEDAGYRQARRCFDDQLSDVWMTVADAATFTGLVFNFHVGEVGLACFYFNYSDPTEETPGGTLYVAGDVTQTFASCASCCNCCDHYVVSVPGGAHAGVYDLYRISGCLSSEGRYATSDYDPGDDSATMLMRSGGDCTNMTLRAGSPSGTLVADATAANTEPCDFGNPQGDACCPESDCWIWTNGVTVTCAD